MSKFRKKDVLQPWFWLIVGGVLAMTAVTALFSLSAISPRLIATLSNTYTPLPITPTPRLSEEELVQECQAECDRRYEEECVPGVNLTSEACYKVVGTMYPGSENPFEDSIENTERLKALHACEELKDALQRGCETNQDGCRQGCEQVI